MDYIDARIVALSENAANSSDCGLTEALTSQRIREELFALANTCDHRCLPDGAADANCALFAVSKA